MRGQVAHAAPAGISRLHVHRGVQPVVARLVLPGTAQREVALGLISVAAHIFVDGAVLHYVAPLVAGVGRRSGDVAGIGDDEPALVVEVVAAATDEVNGSVEVAVNGIRTLAGHLRVLLGLHGHITEDGLVAAIYCYADGLAVRLVEVGQVAHGEVLQVLAAAVADVQHGIADVATGAADDDAVLRLADERDVVGIDPLHGARAGRAQVVGAVLQEDDLALGSAVLVGSVDGTDGVLQLVGGRHHVVVGLLLHHSLGSRVDGNLDGSAVRVAIGILNSTGSNAQRVVGAVAEVPDGEVESSGTALGSHAAAIDGGRDVVDNLAVEGNSHYSVVVHYGDVFSSLHGSSTGVLLLDGQLNPSHGLTALRLCQHNVCAGSMSFQINDDVVLGTLAGVVVFVVNRDVCCSTGTGNSRQTGIVTGVVVRAVLHDDLLDHDVAGYAEGIAVAVHLEELVVAVETGGGQRIDAVAPGVALNGTLVGLDIDALVTNGRGICVYII